MLYSLGLINEKEIKFNKNLLLLKLSVFSFLNSIFYGEKRKQLFPPLKNSTIFNITNKFGNGPIVCAADDLELSLEGNNEQIEFYNNYVLNSLPDTQSSESFQTQMYDPTYGIGQQNAMNSTYFHNQHMMLNSTQQTFQFDQYYVFNYKGLSNTDYATNFNQNAHRVSNGNSSNNISHYNLNMFGINSAPYFNDFGGSKSEVDSHYSSSVDSNASPLDEEFYKNNRFRATQAQTRKRTFEDISSNEKNVSNSSSFSEMSGNAFYDIDHIFNDMLIKNEEVFDTVPYQELKVIHLVYESDNTETVTVKKFKSEVLEKVEDPEFPYQCTHCDAKFKVKGYLTRHLKKHNPSKAFICPFYEEPKDGNEGSKCHPTGGFSRRDTYKTHLKALHFVYPPGTKSNKRNMISGRCAGCFKHFESNYQWLEEHIERGECDGTVLYKNKN